MRPCKRRSLYDTLQYSNLLPLLTRNDKNAQLSYRSLLRELYKTIVQHDELRYLARQSPHKSHLPIGPTGRQNRDCRLCVIV